MKSRFVAWGAKGVGVIFISHSLAGSDQIVVLRRRVKAGECLTAAANPDEIVRLNRGRLTPPAFRITTSDR